MRTILNKMLISPGPDALIIREWKRSAFRIALKYGLIPLMVPIIIGFAAFGVWTMVAAGMLLLASFFAAYVLAGNDRLVSAVTISIAGVLLINYYYLLVIRNCDGLYFTVFMIILAGIFLDARFAFGWAVAQSAALIVIAHYSSEYTVFPDFAQYFDNRAGIPVRQGYFSTIIFISIVSAVLSIFFQRYVTDLLQKIEQSHEEKVALESELLQSQKLESIGLLVSGIAHDFGKGLSTIISSAKLILVKFCGQDKELARYAQNIYDAGTMISESSKKLLAFARKSNDEMAHLNMHEVIENMTTLLAFMLGKQIRIAMDLAARRSTITGNFSQLQSVLMNLAVNAYDAMPQGGDLTFATRNAGPVALPAREKPDAAGPDEYLEIKVSDNGVGIEDAVKEKLFTPFFTTKTPDKGTGLGLSNVHRIVKGHGGTIVFSSEKGKGTVFTIYLPLASRPGTLEKIKI